MILSTRTTLRNTLTLLALALSAGAAMAQEFGMYAGATIGRALPPDSTSIAVGSDVVLHGDGDDQTDQMWQLFAGYRVNRYFSIEAGYLDLGAAHDVLTDTSGATDAQVSARFRAHGPTLSVIGSYPIGSWEPYLKAGILFSDTELSVDGSVGGTPFSASLGGKSNDLLYGIGLGYNVNERWQVKLDLTKLNNVGDKDTGNVGYLAPSLGFSVRF